MSDNGVEERSKVHLEEELQLAAPPQSVPETNPGRKEVDRERLHARPQHAQLWAYLPRMSQGQDVSLSCYGFLYILDMGKQTVKKLKHKYWG